ncbi:MAG: hypothetical protein Fur0046_18080 [Cyanobacteria bacterium J069]|nr:MAG: hypothetical protein D6742_09400 [Cyanobacteria bacterium J069]
MKSGLQRIEATLNQLDTRPDAEAEPRGDRQPASSKPLDLPLSANRPTDAKGDRPPQENISSSVSSSPALPIAPTIAPIAHSSISHTIAAASTANAAPMVPELPGFPFAPIALVRHATDPALALGILREIEGTLLSWQRELQRLQLEIQELHLEGPIIDGWLESQPNGATPPEAEFLRHAEIDSLMGYVETICEAAPDGMIQDTPRAGYRLCGLDADGQVWSRACPPERVPQVSLAIARCQKVRQLVTRKTDLESRLSRLAEHLVAVHSELTHAG